MQLIVFWIYREGASSSWATTTWLQKKLHVGPCKMRGIILNLWSSRPPDLQIWFIFNIFSTFTCFFPPYFGGFSSPWPPFAEKSILDADQYFSEECGVFIHNTPNSPLLQTHFNGNWLKTNFCYSSLCPANGGGHPGSSWIDSHYMSQNKCPLNILATLAHVFNHNWANVKPKCLFFSFLFFLTTHSHEEV